MAYNFRGVGQSEGEYDHGKGEQAHSKQIEVNALCTVAPPVGLYDFSGLLLDRFSETGGRESFWTLIQGGQDEVVSAKEVLNWAMSQSNKPDVYWRERAGHFFHGELIWLKKVILLAF